MTSSSPATYVDLSKPILVTVDAQDIGRLYASNTNPSAFRQYLIERLREAGAPVEWSPAGLKFKYGELAKFKRESEPGRFTYAWCPDTWVLRMKEDAKRDGVLV